LFRVYLSRFKIHLISHLVSFREIGNPTHERDVLTYAGIVMAHGENVVTHLRDVVARVGDVVAHEEDVVTH
jgi:hypothetical protein